MSVGDRRARLGWSAAGVGALTVLLAAGRPWVLGAAQDPVLGRSTLSLSGGELGRAASAGALLALAGVLAGLLAGNRARWPACLGLLVGGGVAAWQAGTVLADPGGAATRSGATGDLSGVLLQVTDPSVTLWPVVTLLGAVVVAGAGVALLLPRRARPADGPASPETGPSASDGRGRRVSEEWDRLDRGEDPTVPDADGAPLAHYDHQGDPAPTHAPTEENR